MNTDQFSEETHRLLHARSSWWLRWGNVLILLFMLACLILFSLIKVKQHDSIPIYGEIIDGKKMLVTHTALPDMTSTQLVVQTQAGPQTFTLLPFRKKLQQRYVTELPPELDPFFSNQVVGYVTSHSDRSLLACFFQGVF